LTPAGTTGTTWGNNFVNLEIDYRRDVVERLRHGGQLGFTTAASFHLLSALIILLFFFFAKKKRVAKEKGDFLPKAPPAKK
jgi:hypothetical protein